MIYEIENDNELPAEYGSIIEVMAVVEAGLNGPNCLYEYHPTVLRIYAPIKAPSSPLKQIAVATPTDHGTWVVTWLDK